MSEISWGKLPERWNCTEPAYDLCYSAPDDDQHIPLSAIYVEGCVGELMSEYQGETIYHDPPTVFEMPESCTKTTSNLREDVEELPPMVSSHRAADEGQDILSANHVEVSADESKLASKRTHSYYAPTAVTMPESSTNTRSNLREGVEGLPSVIPNHPSLSANHVEVVGIMDYVWVNELCNGNTSYHDLPGCGKTPWSSTNTTSNLQEGVDEFPPLRSPRVLSSEQWDQIVSTGMKEILRAKLRKPTHYLCYRVPDDHHHIPQSPNDAEVWVDELCQGKTTCHEPPTVITIPARFTTPPGYKVKIAGLRDMLNRGKTPNKFLRKFATLPTWGMVIQESIDLLSVIGSRLHMLSWRSMVGLAVITSLLYNFFIKSTLHTNLDEVSSAFAVRISRYLSDPVNQHPLSIGALADVIDNVCHTLAQSTKIAVSLFINLEMLENVLDSMPLFIVHDGQFITRVVDVGNFKPGQMDVVLDLQIWNMRVSKCVQNLLSTLFPGLFATVRRLAGRQKIDAQRGDA
ncbi:hypothetical protein BU17DRAFT_68537 [Hysterangium stoloniferum]|nr:hypothetical protein BU17DRAFT_68537 [Hysterangium stoloniferum]